MPPPLDTFLLRASMHLADSRPATKPPNLDPLRAFLVAQARIAGAEVEGIRGNLDPEHLHDFRVALRRTRAVVSQLRKVFPEAVFARYKEGFAWLGALTGRARDLDVYLLALPRYRRALPAAAGDGLRSFEAFLAEARGREQERLLPGLSSQRFRELLDGWNEFLRRGEMVAPAGRPVGALLARRLRKAFRRVLREGEALGASSDSAEFHDLRLEAKKLRYLLELSRSFHPEGEAQPFVRELKYLQEGLGAINDYQVQQDSLEVYAGEVPAAATGAVRLLREHLESCREKERRRFAERFRGFASTARGERVDGLLQALVL